MGWNRLQVAREAMAAYEAAKQQSGRACHESGPNLASFLGRPGPDQVGAGGLVRAPGLGFRV